jgi:hypothetical protein
VKRQRPLELRRRARIVILLEPRDADVVVAVRILAALGRGLARLAVEHNDHQQDAHDRAG